MKECPSVETPGKFYGLSHEPCTTTACTWWKGGRCTARIETFLGAEKLLAKRVPVLPPCPLEGVCRWQADARKEGKPGCEVRMLGMVCEHQGGEWNTFMMAPWEEWDD